MIITTKTLVAKDMAEKAHKGQLDKAGAPYILHPLYLAEQCEDEKTTIVALLHDVFEDSDCYSFDDLEARGFDADVIEAVRCLTHKESVAYMDYIAALKSNNLARRVKLLDLKHNLDINRVPREEQEEFIKKMSKKRALYQEALKLLED